jgi:hypothetical protein
MTAAGPPAQPPPPDLTARVFRALYPGYDLHDLAGTWLALPKGTPWHTAPAIGEIARQLAAREHHPPAAYGPADPAVF